MAFFFTKHSAKNNVGGEALSMIGSDSEFRRVIWTIPNNPKLSSYKCQVQLATHEIQHTN